MHVNLEKLEQEKSDLVKEEKEVKEAKEVKSASRRDPPNPSPLEQDFNSPSEEFTDSLRAESQPRTELDQLLPSTQLPFSST